MSASSTLPHRQVVQAKALLWAAESVANQEIARRCRAARHLIASRHRNCQIEPLPSPTRRSLRPKAYLHRTRDATPLQSESPLGILGHESGFSPDGRTLWISTTAEPGVTVIDVSNPRLPSIVWHSFNYTFHGMNLSDDGNNRLYSADLGTDKGLTVLDVSQVQRRVRNPVVTPVSHVTWPTISIPKNSDPVTIRGRKYLVEFDEYVGGDDVGAARIIDITSEKRPKVVSNIRLEVHQPAARATDQKNDRGRRSRFRRATARTTATCRARSSRASSPAA